MSLKTKAKEVDGNYVLDGITIGRVTDLKPNEWFGRVMLNSMGEENAEYGLLDPMAIVEGDDGVTYKDPKGGSDGSRGSLLNPDGTPRIESFKTSPKTYLTTVGLYNDADELLAVAKLSQPILKSKSREALIKVKLDF